MSAAFTPRQAVELFHLLFLRVFSVGPDKGHFAIKGGCNLRFFFRSVRYSEDLDIDVSVVAKQTLKNKVERLLSGQPLAFLLKTHGLTIIETSSPKQTETTQRWKIALSLAGTAVPLRTKIEFSRRRFDDDVAFEGADADLARGYGISAPLASHYRAPAAIAQKIDALAHRSVTQARDLFDLHLLLTTHPVRLSLDRTLVDQAIEHGLSLTFDDFAGQVLPFLLPDHQSLYDSAVWAQIQEDVLTALDRMRP